MGETENDQGTKVVPWVGELLSQVRAGCRDPPLSPLLISTSLVCMNG